MYIPSELIQITYDVYIRRSSDDTDHQVASLESQKEVLVKLAKENGLKVLRIAEESMSAKQPGRPVFNEEMLRIQEGEIQGLIVWDLSRCSRNPIDSGTLSWLLQTEKLKVIVSPQRIYQSQDNVLLLNIEFGQANQFLRDLSRNVKRGLQTKRSNGWRPGIVPEGYMNDNVSERGKKEILIDPIRFPLIRKAWELLFTGNYSVAQILRTMSTNWGYRTNKHKKFGGKPISKSGLYCIFSNTFYYGDFESPVGSGNWYIGKHPPMITKEEYDRAQIFLGKKGKPRPKTHEFAFTGIICCGECSGMVTAEEKWQIRCTSCKTKFSSLNKTECSNCNLPIAQMSKPKIAHYIYYHCSKRFNKNCTQKVIRLEELEDQIDFLLSQIEIPESFKQWAVAYLNELHDGEMVGQKAVNGSIDEAYSDCLARIGNLVKLKISPMNTDGSVLSDEDFAKQMGELKKEKTGLEGQKKLLGKRVDDWLELSEKTFNFACYARLRFQHGTLQEKKEILATVGSNLILNNRLLSVSLPKPFVAVEKAKVEVDRLVARFEPVEKIDSTVQLMQLYAKNMTLQGCSDSN